MSEASKVERNSRGYFMKGSAKPIGSGRKKGTPNKKTAELKELLGDFNSVDEMKNLYYSTDDDNLKFSICKEFLKYVYPQRKAVEMDVQSIELPKLEIEGL